MNYGPGDQVVLTGQFNDTGGSAAAATGVTFDVYYPNSGTPTAYAHGETAAVLDSKTGWYFIAFALPAYNAQYIGTWVWRVTGTCDSQTPAAAGEFVYERYSNDDLKTEIDANETKIDTIDTVVDGIQTDLDNATDGLGALKTEIDANETKIDNVDSDLVSHNTLLIGHNAAAAKDATVAKATPLAAHDSKLVATLGGDNKVVLSTDAQDLSATLGVNAKGAMLSRLLGLVFENSYIDTIVTNDAGNMTSCRFRTYSVAGSVGTDNNVLATYTITATYDDAGEISTYKVVKA